MKKAVWGSSVIALFIALPGLAQAQTAIGYNNAPVLYAAGPAEPKPWVNHKPTGSLDEVTSTIVAGNASDSDSNDFDVYVQIYSETAGITKFVDTIMTTSGRTNGVVQNHTFSFTKMGKLCDARLHLIHAYVVDAQTGETVELAGSPKSLTCGFTPTQLSIGGRITNQIGLPLTAAVNQVQVSLYQILKSGEAIWINQTDYNEGVDVNGLYYFVGDSNDKPLEGGIYEVVVSARNYAISRARFTFGIDGSHVSIVMNFAALTIYNNGTAIWSSPAPGQIQVPVLICSSGYMGGNYAQANILLSGPGLTSAYIQVPSIYYFWVPTDGMCSQMTIPVYVDPNLPNGYIYCTNIKVGLIDKPEEIYSETGSCILKGVKPR